MEKLKEKYPKAVSWIQSLDPFVVIRGDTSVIVKFSDGRPSLTLNYEKIAAFEESGTSGLSPDS